MAYTRRNGSIPGRETEQHACAHVLHFLIDGPRVSAEIIVSWTRRRALQAPHRTSLHEPFTDAATIPALPTSSLRACANATKNTKPAHRTEIACCRLDGLSTECRWTKMPQLSCYTTFFFFFFKCNGLKCHLSSRSTSLTFKFQNLWNANVRTLKRSFCMS